MSGDTGGGRRAGPGRRGGPHRAGAPRTSSTVPAGVPGTVPGAEVPGARGSSLRAGGACRLGRGGARGSPRAHPAEAESPRVLREAPRVHPGVYRGPVSMPRGVPDRAPTF